ncbi:MAG: hypothetical protein QF582_23960, partial [Alphaproteobacteria bacterium]|nr:hypothetical protein [Alphaproteobacteria bacterium]
TLLAEETCKTVIRVTYSRKRVLTSFTPPRSAKTGRSRPKPALLLPALVAVRKIFVALRHDFLADANWRLAGRPIILGAMDEPDLQALARRYLDLWERQAAAMAGDADTAEVMARWLSALVTGEGPAVGANPAQGDEIGGDGSETGATGSGAPAAGPAHLGGDDDVAEFARRLAECARRITALEAGTGGGSGGADGGVAGG